MPFEYYNPHQFSIDCSIRQPVGTLRVAPSEYLPSPDDEMRGITADVLAPFVCKNLLHPTPPALRRRLFRDHQIPVPADLEASTSHLAEFGGAPEPAREGTSQEAAPKPAPAPKKNYLKTVHIGEIAQNSARGTPNLDETMRGIADRMCSSVRVKNVDNPK